MPVVRIGRSRRAVLAGAACLALAASGCAARLPTVGAAAVPPIPPGAARIWVYRIYDPTEALNMTEVTINRAYAGYAQLGGAFYRDVRPGHYHVVAASTGIDVNQAANVDLAAGQQAYVRVESLRSWAEGFFGDIRDTFYARLVPPRLARAEIAASTYYGGS
jgi:hypothetical protein